MGHYLILILTLILVTGNYSFTISAKSKEYIVNTFPVTDTLEITELEEMVKELDTLDNVEVREYVDTYFKLAEAYFKSGRKDDTIKMLEKGLRIESWNYRYQVMLAELEIEKKIYQSAVERLNFVNQNCNNVKITDYVVQLLTKPELKKAKIRKELKPVLPEFKLYILKFKGCHPIIAEAIASRITQEFGIKVEILNKTLNPDKRNLRNRRNEFLNGIINEIKDNLGFSVYHHILKELKIPFTEADTTENKEKIVKFYCLQQKDGEEYWEFLKISMEDQYDANVLLEQIALECESELQKHKVLGILGIMAQDICSEDTNFLFGKAKTGDVGVMSYARFYQSSTPVDVAIKRAVMQAFSSTGFIIGIDRCTTATCARAYPHSLEEHDRKEDKLCRICIENLRHNYQSRK